MTSNCTKHGLVLLVIVAITAAVYVPSLAGNFVYDDNLLLAQAPLLGASADLSAFASSRFQQTRPVALLAFALCFRLGGGSPLPFRVTSLVFHLLVVVLVYAMGLGLERRFERAKTAGQNGGPARPGSIAAASGLIFGVHPLATESVAYISAQAGLLAAAFGLLSTLLYLRFEAWPLPRPMRSWLWYAGSLVSLAIALLSKESAAITPLLTLLWWVLLREDHLRGLKARQLLPLAAQLLFAAVTMAGLFSWAHYPHADTFGMSLMPWWPYLLTQIRVVAYALLLCVYPVSLNIDYDFRLSTSLWDASLLVSVVTVGVVAVFAWVLRRRAPLLLFALLWFCIAIAPTNSVVQFRDLLAERHLYLPLVGMTLLLGWALGFALTRLRERGRNAMVWTVRLSAGAIIVVLGLSSASRADLIGDPVALWRDAVEKSPDKGRPQLNLGIALLQRGAKRDGLAHLERAVTLEPDRYDAHYNLGAYYEREGRLREAVRHFRRALTLRPSAKYKAALARALNRLGAKFYATARLTAAAAAFEEAIALDHGGARSRFNLALVRLRQGQLGRARVLLQEALARDPSHTKARRWLKRLSASAETESH